MSSRFPPKIHFFFEGSTPDLKQRRNLKGFILSIFKLEKREFEAINFIFTNDRIIRGINKKYLSHDYSTDVITFELSDESRPVIAEVYISCDRVKDNALNHKTSFRRELHRVIFHGVLHLCGYRDKGLSEIRKMRAKEDQYLSLYLS